MVYKKRKRMTKFLHSEHKLFQHSLSCEYLSKVFFLFWLLRVTADGREECNFAFLLIVSAGSFAQN